MEFAVDEGCGRSVVAAVDFLPGDVVHQEVAYAMARVDRSLAPSRRRYCIRCWTAIRGPVSAASATPRNNQGDPAAVQLDSPTNSAVEDGSLRADTVSPAVKFVSGSVKFPAAVGSQAATTFVTCAQCSSADYCSASCLAQYHEDHAQSGECAALCALSTVSQKSTGKGAIPAEDWNTFAAVLVAIARAKSEGLTSLLAVTMATTSEVTAVGQSLNESHQATMASSTTTAIGLPSDVPPGNEAVPSVPEVAAYSNVQTVGLGFEGPLPPLYDCVARPSTTVVTMPCGGSSRIPSRASFREMQRLVTNRSSMDGEIREDYARLYDHYIHLMRTSRSAPRTNQCANGNRGSAGGAPPNVDGIPGSAEFGGTPPVTKDPANGARWWRDAFPDEGAVSCDVFLNLCCAFQANGFGVWDSRGRGVAAGFFPCSSFFNHSCAPNLARRMDGRCVTFVAAKPIAKGEPMCLSYVDFKLPRDVRRAKLLATYSFLCRCPRCEDDAALDHRDRYDLPLCQNCTSKVLCPVRNAGGQLLGECPCCLARVELL